MEPPPKRSIHVVAAAITDVRGRLLLARRGNGRDLAGLWEFPGGKREPDESAEDALVRELREELDITGQVGVPLIEVPQEYPDKFLRLDVRRMTRWNGVPRGAEGQALAWVPVDKLHRYPMPPADRPVVAMLQQPDRYLVTPEPGGDPEAWLAALQQALDDGVRRVQLRARAFEAGPHWPALAARAVALCRTAGAQVLLNAQAKLARDLGVGLHLRGEQLERMSARPSHLAGPLAASCHSPEQVAAAQALGCDFIVVGSVRATASHPGGPVLGWDGFERLRLRTPLPIYAIGGLGPADIAEARRHGAQGIAAIRGLWPLAC
ncbi:MAG: Nudix family hydrolase [Pseudoxanthomonas sp.]